MRRNLKDDVARELVDQGVRQVDHRFLDVRLRQGHHLLAGGDDLPGFGIPRGDDGFVVRAQFDIVELILGLIDRRLRLIERGLGGLQVGLRDIELRLGADAAIEQFLLPPGAGLGVDVLRLDAGQIALGGTQLILLIGRVQGGEQRALFHFGTDIDVTAGDAPRHAEPDIAFIAGLDAAGKAAEMFLVQRFDLDRQHRTYRLRRRFLFRASRQHHRRAHQ